MNRTEEQQQLIASLNKANEVIELAYAHYNVASEKSPNLLKSRKWFRIIGIITLAMVGISVIGFLGAIGDIGLVKCLMVLLSRVPSFAIFAGITYFFYRKMTTTQNIIQQENGAGDAIIRENLETLSILPNKYHFPAASEYILESVSTGRADGLKEAVLQTEEQIHRWNIEAGYSAMMQQMAEMNKRLSDIEWRVWTAPTF